MAKFIVKTPIKHDGELYQPGEEIELSKKQAEAAGTAVEAPARKAEKPAGKEK